MFLLWMVNLAIRADNPNLSTFTDYPNPAADGVAPIPDCADDPYTRTPCFDFFYTPNNSAAVDVRRDAMRAGGTPAACLWWRWSRRRRLAGRCGGQTGGPPAVGPAGSQPGAQQYQC